MRIHTLTTFSSTFIRNLQQNKQTWVILQKFRQKTNLKMLIFSVYNEVKTKYIYKQVYTSYAIVLMKKITQHL